MICRSGEQSILISGLSMIDDGRHRLRIEQNGKLRKSSVEFVFSLRVLLKRNSSSTS